MTPQDVGAVLGLIAQHLEDDAKYARRYFQEYFTNQDRVNSADEEHFVIVDRGINRILGVSGYTPDKYHYPGICWLGWTYVDMEYRRKGLGSALLQYVIDMAHGRGIRKLYIDTSSDPIYGAAVRLYEKFGFTIEGVLSDYYRSGEDYLILGRAMA